MTHRPTINLIQEHESASTHNSSPSKPTQVLLTPAKPARSPIRRCIAETKQWATPEIQSAIYESEKQSSIIAILSKSSPDTIRPEDITSDCIAVFGEIRKKMHGYVSQDKRNRRVYTQPVNVFQIIHLLHQSNMQCHYCRDFVRVLYVHRRDPKQWTLDRIDNRQAHDISNVVIACLSCNLQRRCQSSNKYAMSKKYTSICMVEVQEDPCDTH